MKCFPCPVQRNSSTRLAGVRELSASAQHLPEIINTRISHGERLAPLQGRGGAGGTSSTRQNSVLDFPLRQTRSSAEGTETILSEEIGTKFNLLMWIQTSHMQISAV